MTRQYVEEAVPWGDACFDCKQRGHWKGNYECPANSASESWNAPRAVAQLARACSICHTAQFNSVCGGCGKAVVKGSRVAPMNGLGQHGNTVWWHVECSRGQLAVVQSRAQEAKIHHHETPEIMNVLQWVRNTAPPSRQAVVWAGPGTGKTQLVTRITQALALLKEPVKKPLVLAFNREAAAELVTRAVSEHSWGSERPAWTFHAYGKMLWAKKHPRMKVKAAKIRQLLQEEYPREGNQPPKHKYRRDVQALVGHVVKLVGLCKARVLDPLAPDFHDRLVETADCYDISDALQRQARGQSIAGSLKKVLEMATFALHRSIKVAHEHGVIDFNDMIYMPVYDGLVEPHDSVRSRVKSVRKNGRGWVLTFTRTTQGWVIVDECQDMDEARASMARQLSAGGRLIAVGDPNQAIYLYSGAGDHSLWRQERFETFALSCR